MRIFLTGVSGYLGSVLAEHLARLPEVETITGISRTTPKSALPSKVKFVKMDIRSPDLAAAMAGHDVVIHTAFIVMWLAKMPARVRDDINLNGIRNVAQAALTNKVSRFLHASSVAAYDLNLVGGKKDVTEDFPIGKGDSSFYYSNGKAIAERTLTEVLGASGILMTFLRPIYIIGPCNRGTVENFRENAARFPGPDPCTQFIHEDDVATAFIRALSVDMPGAYNVVPDDSIQWSEVWNILGVKSVPTVPVWAARLIAGIRWRYFGSSTHASWVETTRASFTASNLRLKGTGWKPRFGSAEALRTALLV